MTQLAHLSEGSNTIRGGTRGVTRVAAAAIAPVLALLASQLHLLHLLIIGGAAGSAGLSFMAAYPSLRRVMLVVSLLSAGFGLFRVWRRHQSRAAWLLAGVSATLTVALVAWSVVQFGP